MEEELNSLFEKLQSRFGTTTEVARQLGIPRTTYRDYRRRGISNPLIEIGIRQRYSELIADEENGVA